VSSIREALTYPHYTKEIVQAILYVQSGGKIAPADLRSFRNMQIGAKIGSARKLRREFKKTDVFVVEVASKIIYKKRDDYWHHHFIDSLPIDSELRQEYEIRELSDFEIEEDLRHIVELLAPKPVVFATHFSNRTSGARQSLIQSIQEFCSQNGILCINPSKLLKLYRVNELVESEEVITHFTTSGHARVGSRYREAIHLAYASSQNRCPHFLIQNLDNSPERIASVGIHGLGDDIMGSLKVYEQAWRYGKIPGISIQRHQLREFLDVEVFDNEPGRTSNVVHKIFHENSDRLFKHYDDVYTNKRVEGSIDDGARDFVLRKLLTPNAELQRRIKVAMAALSLTTPFNVVHVRLGDQFENKIHTELELHSIYTQLNRNLKVKGIYSGGKSIAYLTDSSQLDSYLMKQGESVRISEKVHLGESMLSVEGIAATLVDFFIMKHAEGIHQFSIYGWGSGFSEAASAIFEVPLFKYPQISLNNFH
jgi:hypothetical protein